MTTYHTVSIADPAGAEHEIELRAEWSEFQRNPCDKEPRMYQGEDDGHELKKAEVVS